MKILGNFNPQSLGEQSSGQQALQECYQGRDQWDKWSFHHWGHIFPFTHDHSLHSYGTLGNPSAYIWRF